MSEIDISLRVKVDDTQLQKDLRQIEKSSQLVISPKFDDSDLRSTLNDIRSEKILIATELNTRVIESQIKKLNKTLSTKKVVLKLDIEKTGISPTLKDVKKTFGGSTLKPQVDHSELKELNDHLDIKEKHFFKLKDILDTNPLKVGYEKNEAIIEDFNLIESSYLKTKTTLEQEIRINRNSSDFQGFQEDLDKLKTRKKAEKKQIEEPIEIRRRKEDFVDFESDLGGLKKTQKSVKDSVEETIRTNRQQSDIDDFKSELAGLGAKYQVTKQFLERTIEINRDPADINTFKNELDSLKQRYYEVKAQVEKEINLDIDLGNFYKDIREAKKQVRKLVNSNNTLNVDFIAGGSGSSRKQDIDFTVLQNSNRKDANKIRKGIQDQGRANIRALNNLQTSLTSPFSVISAALLQNLTRDVTVDLSANFAKTFLKKSGFDLGGLGTKAGEMFGGVGKAGGDLAGAINDDLRKYVKTIFDRLGVETLSKDLDKYLSASLLEAASESLTFEDLKVNLKKRLQENAAAISLQAMEAYQKLKSPKTYLDKAAFESTEQETSKLIAGAVNRTMMNNVLTRYIGNQIAPTFDRYLKGRREAGFEAGVQEVIKRAKEIYGASAGDISKYEQDPTKLSEKKIAATSTKAAPMVVNEGTKELIITIGGYAGHKKKRSGLRIAADIAAKTPKEIAAIGVPNPDTDLPAESIDAAFAVKTQALFSSLAKPNLRGFSKDAVEMAAQAVSALQVNPELQIKFLGESGGGFAAEEATKLMQMLGYGERVKGAGFGTPQFIGGINPENFKKYISPDKLEHLGAEVHATYAPLGFADVSAPEQNIKGVKGHRYEFYRPTKEYKQFVGGETEGEIGEADVKAIGDYLKNIRQQALNNSLDSMEQLKKDLQSVAMSLKEAGGRTEDENIKKQLNAYVKQAEGLLEAAPFLSSLGTKRKAIENAKKALQTISVSGSKTTGKQLEQLSKEIALMQIDLLNDINSGVDSVTKEAEEIYKELSTVKSRIGKTTFKNPEVYKFGFIKNVATEFYQQQKQQGVDVAKTQDFVDELVAYQSALSDLLNDFGKAEIDIKGLKEATKDFKKVKSAKEKLDTLAKSPKKIQQLQQTIAENTIDEKQYEQAQEQLKPFQERSEIAKEEIAKAQKIIDDIKKQEIAEAKEAAKPPPVDLKQEAVKVAKGAARASVGGILAESESKDRAIKKGETELKQVDKDIELARKERAKLNQSDNKTEDIINRIKALDAQIEQSIKKRLQIQEKVNAAKGSRSFAAQYIAPNLKGIIAETPQQPTEKVIDAQKQKLQEVRKSRIEEAKKQIEEANKRIAEINKKRGGFDKAISSFEEAEKAKKEIEKLQKQIESISKQESSLKETAKSYSELAAAKKKLDQLSETFEANSKQELQDLLAQIQEIQKASQDLVRAKQQPQELQMPVESYLQAQPEKELIQAQPEKPQPKVQPPPKVEKPSETPKIEQPPVKPIAEKPRPKLEAILIQANKSLEELKDITANFKEALKVVKETSDLEKKKSYAKTISNTIESAVKDVQNFIESLPAEERTKPGAGAGSANLKSQLSVTKKATDKLLQEVNESIAEIERSSVEGLKILVTELGNYFKTKAQELKAQAGDQAKETARQIIAAQEVAREVLKDLGQKSEIKEEIKPKVTATKTKVTKATKSAQESIGEDIGKATAEGMEKGVKQQLQSIAKVGRDLGLELSDSTKKALDIRSPSREYEEIGNLVVEGLRVGISSLGNVLRDSNERIIDFGLRAAASLYTLSNAFKAIGGTFVQIKQVIETNLLDMQKNFEDALELRSIKGTIKAFSKDGEKAFERLIDTANELGQSIKSLSQTKLAFQLSLQGTTAESISGDLVKDFTQGLSAFAPSAERFDLAMTALQQIASKGVVSMEELRQQLSESLPGAFAIAARSMGMTQQEFTALVSSGNLLSEEFLPKFAKQLKAETMQAFIKSSNSARFSLNELKNEVFLTSAAMGQFSTEVGKPFFEVLSNSLRFLRANFQIFSTFITSIFLVNLWQMVKVARQVAVSMGLLSGSTTNAGITVKAFNWIIKVLLKELILITAVVAGLTVAAEGFKVLSGGGNEFIDSVKETRQITQKLTQDLDDAFNKLNEIRREQGKPIIVRVIREDKGEKEESLLEKAQNVLYGKNQPKATNPFLQGADALLNAVYSTNRIYKDLARGQTPFQEKLNYFGRLEQANTQVAAYENLQEVRKQIDTIANSYGSQVEKQQAIENIIRLQEQLKSISVNLKIAKAKPEIDQKEIDRLKEQLQLKTRDLDALKETVFPAGGLVGLEQARKQLEEQRAALKQKVTDQNFEEIQPQIQAINNELKILDYWTKIVSSDTEKLKEQYKNIATKILLLDRDIQNRAYDIDLKSSQQQLTLYKQELNSVLSPKQLELKLKLSEVEKTKAELDNIESEIKSKLEIVNKDVNLGTKELTLGAIRVDIEGIKRQLFEDITGIGNIGAIPLESLQFDQLEPYLSGDELKEFKKRLETRLNKEMGKLKPSDIDAVVNILESSKTPLGADQKKILEIIKQIGEARKNQVETEIKLTQQQKDVNNSRLDGVKDELQKVKELSDIQKEKIKLNLLEKLSAGEISRPDFDIRLKELENDSIRETIALKQKELEAVKQAAREGRINAREAIASESQLTKELADLKLDLLDKEKEKRLELIGIRQESLELIDLEIKKNRNLLSSYDRLDGTVNLYQKLISAQQELASARTSLGESQDRGELERLEKAIELRKTLRDENASFEDKRKARSQLKNLGVFGNLRSLEQQRAALQDKADLNRLKALKEQQRLNFQLLQIDRTRELSAARRAIQEAKTGKLESAKNVLNAQLELEKALVSGDDRKIKIAKLGLDIAQQELGLSQQKIKDAQQALQVERQITKLKLEANKKQSQAELINATNEIRLNNPDLLIPKKKRQPIPTDYQPIVDIRLPGGKKLDISEYEQYLKPKQSQPGEQVRGLSDLQINPKLLQKERPDNFQPIVDVRLPNGTKLDISEYKDYLLPQRDENKLIADRDLLRTQQTPTRLEDLPQYRESSFDADIREIFRGYSPVSLEPTSQEFARSVDRLSEIFPQLGDLKLDPANEERRNKQLADSLGDRQAENIEQKSAYVKGIFDTNTAILGKVTELLNTVKSQPSGQIQINNTIDSEDSQSRADEITQKTIGAIVNIFEQATG